jgi:serine/threonine protein kinase/DNA-binding response OmpR family regulator
MGTVFKARHRRMKRLVALKLLPRTPDLSAELIERFQREVEVIARLQHPNIVLAYDADESPIGHFLIMEFIDGRDLASEVRQHGLLPVRDAVAAVSQAAQALDYAHRQGIVHRDVKPANLLRDRAGVVKVADLGLARISAALQGGTLALTQAGGYMGTADYVPPEQAEDSTLADGRADVYALAGTLHFLLVGEPPYPAPTLMATLLKHRTAPIPSLRAARADVPAALDDLFRRMLAKARGARPESMAVVARELAALGELPTQRPGPPRPTILSPAERTAETYVPGSGPRPALSLSFSPPTETQLPAPGVAVDVILGEPSRTQASIIRKFLHGLNLTALAPGATGAQVLEALRARRPRVLLCAMHLADRTATQLLDEIRADPGLADLPVILISSQADAWEAEELARRPNVQVLAKPFDQDRLAQVLTGATGQIIGDPVRDLSACKVLLVEPGAAERQHRRTVLAGLGIRQVTEAEGHDQAAGLLAEQTFDLMVTGLTGPGLDAVALLHHLRRAPRSCRLPVALVAGEIPPGDRDALCQLGVTTVCDPSFTPEAARAFLRQVFGV